MCEAMDPDEVASSDVNSILTAIVNSLRVDLPDGIREAAIIALLNSLDFTSKNFEVQAERDAIVKAVCESTQAQNVKIRQKAFECIAKIPDLYYDKIASYITTFYQLTTTAMSNDVPEVASQAVEFWITVALYEIGVVEDLEDGAEVQYLHIIEQAAKPLINLLLITLTKQPENPDEDASAYISDSGATCIDAFTRILKDSIVDDVLPFITMNITSKDWHLREAAVTAFGSILDGPSDQKMLPIVTQALPVLITCFHDNVSAVKASAGWTIGRICEFHKNAISMESLPLLVTALGVALDDSEAVVASRACFAIHNLAKACQDEADNPTNVLSHFLAPILQKLFVVANRHDWSEENLRSSAYEASNMLICNCAVDMYPVVGQVLVECLNRLEVALNAAMDAQERMNLQSYLCSLLGECIKKLDPTEINTQADRIMRLLLQVFTVRSAIAHEDAFFAIGFTADKLGPKFDRYLQFVRDPLLMGLRNFDEYSVCIIALGTVGDICRALREGVAIICDDVLNAVLEILRSTAVDR
jgi:importin subunit beta-1